MNNTVFYNARVHTQAKVRAVDSIAMGRSRIMAVGRRLECDPEFKRYRKIDLKGKTVVPGLIDSHTHLYFFALSLGRVNLHGATSIDSCLKEIRSFAKKLAPDEWVVGEGYAPDSFQPRVEPDRFMLDRVTGGRPAFIFSKDQHSAWVNSHALEMAGLASDTADPDGGRIERTVHGELAGILRELPAYMPVYRHIPSPPPRAIRARYREALEFVYRNGVTGVHSFDSLEGLDFFAKAASANRLGLRINYYLPAAEAKREHIKQVRDLDWQDFLSISGVKIFADGALGSQTALCFHKYAGTRSNRGVEVTSVQQMVRLARRAARLGLPCAVHAIGDKAVSNVLDMFERAPVAKWPARHRIEHLQLIRRKDIARVKRLGIVASMQPSHCPSDILMINRYWGKRGRNAFIFRSLIAQGIDMAFGSDAPIEPLDPIAGIAAAVRRSRTGKRDIFYPEERLTASEALYRYTVGPAVAVGQAGFRGFLLPGYVADIVILDRDITRTVPSRVASTKVLATIVDGKLKYCHPALKL